MTPERHRLAGEIFHAALAVDLEGRAAFVEAAAHGDRALWHEVESLLSAHTHAGNFIADVGYRHHQVFSDSWMQALALGGNLGSNEVRFGVGVKF